jgi:UDP-glucose 4-epimerase
MEDKIFAGTKVLVTGGAGFIGSNLCRELVARRSTVTVLDNFFTGKLSNLSEIEGKYTLVEGSITDWNLVKQLVAKVDIVFHLAARNIIISTQDPYNDFETNIGGTLNILMAARQNKISRLVYASSASIYGNSSRLPISEDEPANLLSPYAISKYCGEKYCDLFFKTYGVPIVITRYSNIYGAGQDPNDRYCGVIAKLLWQGKNKLPMEIYGDGQQTRDFTYVEDAIIATLLAALSPYAIGKTFNVGTGVETSICCLAEHILNLYHLKQHIHADQRDIDNIYRRVLDIRKIRSVLGWTPKTSLLQGLKLTREWLEKLQD